MILTEAAIVFMSDEKREIEKIKDIFESEFEDLSNSVKSKFEGLGLSALEKLQKELGELRVKHTGKKALFLAQKSLSGRSPPSSEPNLVNLFKQSGNQLNPKSKMLKQALETALKKLKPNAKELM